MTSRRKSSRSAWSLHVELCFYVLIGLGLSRTRWSYRHLACCRRTVDGAGVLPRRGLRRSILDSAGSVSAFCNRSVAVLPAPARPALGVGWRDRPLRSQPRSGASVVGRSERICGVLSVALLVAIIVIGLRDVKPSGRLARWDGVWAISPIRFFSSIARLGGCWVGSAGPSLGASCLPDFTAGDSPRFHRVESLRGQRPSSTCAHECVHVRPYSATQARGSRSILLE